MKKKMLSRLVKADELLFNTDWLGIYTTPDDYTYCTEMKAAGGNKVAVLPYHVMPDTGDFYFMGVVERCQAKVTSPILCSITGKCETDETDLRETAIRELQEEAGLDASVDDLIDLGSIYPSKSMDTEVFCFAVPFVSVDLVEATGDGTAEEEEAYPKWVKMDGVKDCQDPIIHTMVLRLLYNLKFTNNSFTPL